jgi:hypothetical protein
VLLASALSDRLGGGHSGIGASAHLPAGARAHIAPKMADAFGHTFWWALALLVVALLFSSTLPKRKPPIPAGEPLPVVAP